jgi:hypothetical protein
VEKYMGQGGYVFCEWDSVQKEFPDFQKAFAELEARIIERCDADWAPKTCGFLSPGPNQYVRTSILPALFRGWAAAAPYPQLAHWRQYIGSSGHQPLLMGAGTGNVIPEDFKVAWIGLAFPNKRLNITELKWQISDGKFIRVDIEELMSYNKPAVVFEKGYILNEEEAFELYGYVEHADYQRIVMLGACYARTVDRVLGNCGAAIS